MEDIPTNTRIFVIFYSLFAAFACAVGTASAAGVKVEKSGRVQPYTFAVVPYYTPEKIWKLFSPFVEYISTETKQPWKLLLYSNHDEFVEDICNGKISVALAGPIPVGRGYNKCGSRPFLAALAKNGKPVYHAFMVTSDPAARELPDLKGRKIGLFKGSTAAHILPVKMLKNAGVPLSDIQPVFIEGQDRLVTALLSGEVAAAGMKEALFRKIAKENLRVLATSEEVPNFALTALPSFPEKLRRQLTKSLLTLQPLVDSKDAAIVKGWDDEVKNGFVEPDSNFLPAILNLYSIYWEITNESR